MSGALSVVHTLYGGLDWEEARWTSTGVRSNLRKTRTSKSNRRRGDPDYNELYENHGAGRTNLAYGYALKNS
jgi:hypothetical protein